MMKKTLIILCLLFMSTSVYAENMYEYKTNPINCGSNVRREGAADYVLMPSKRGFESVKDMLKVTAASAVVIPALLFDPYVVQIDNNNYVLVKDRADKNWSEKDLLGIDDPKENRFESLIKLNSDNDYSKVTSNELKKAGIRFVRMDSKGALLVNERNKDYDLNKIDYIDIINLKRTANSESTGIFGHFTVYLKTANLKKKTVVGYVTYETDKKLELLFK